MIKWLRKINRSKNYYLKKHKLTLKLKLLCILSPRYSLRRKNTLSDIRHLVLPFIGKGIGDAIVIGGIIDLLVKNKYQVSVIADKRTHFLFAEWTNISNLYFYDPKKTKGLIKKLKAINPFVFVDSHEITHSSVSAFNLMMLVKPAKTIGFNSKHSIYDNVVKIKNPLGHVSSRYVDLLEFLGVHSTEPYDYSVCIPEKNKNEGIDFINTLKGKEIITFIPYGSVSERLFTNEQIDALLNYFSQHDDFLHIVIIGEQDKIKGIKDREYVSKNTHPSFFTAAQLIKESALVISPDTSFVHLSRSFQRRMVCIYPLKILINGADNADTWGPNYGSAVQIRLKERRIQDADINSIIEYIDTEINKMRNTAQHTKLAGL